jgi:hypothetical protein
MTVSPRFTPSPLRCQHVRIDAKVNQVGRVRWERQRASALVLLRISIFLRLCETLSVVVHEACNHQNSLIKFGAQ